MQRVPEPELMDTAAQAEAYARADFAAPNAAFVARLLARFATLDGGVVDLGCGPADIPIRLCRARPALRVTAIDGASAMLDEARRAVDRAGLGLRIELVRGCIPGSLPQGRRFGAVLSNSLLHHLADPDLLWREVLALGAPGAAVFVGDLFRPATPEAARALVAAYAAGEPEVLRTDFHNSLWAAFTVDEVREQLARCGLAAALTVEPVSDRHLLVHGRLPG